MTLEKSEGKNPQRGASAPDSSHLQAARTEHHADIQVRSSKAETVNAREEAMFSSGFNFKHTDTQQTHSDKTKALAGKDNKEHQADEKGTLDCNQPIAAKPNAPRMSDMDSIIDGAQKHWEDLGKKGKEEGGVSGKIDSLTASVMGSGVDAFKAAHDLVNEFFPEGIDKQSRSYWDQLKSEGKQEGGLVGKAKELSAGLMNGFLDLSNIGNVEDGSKKVAKDLNNGVPADKLKSDATSLGVDTALAAMTVIPGVTGVKGMLEGGNLYRTARAGTEIAGMAASETRAAANVAGKLMEASAESLPAAGEKLGKRTIESFVGNLKDVAKQYGIEIKEGGMIGESKGGMNAIEYSSKAGGPHEVVHLAQQIQTRATALETTATQLGKDVSQLTQAERASAFENIVKPFENGAYNQHEMWAGAAHSWGKTNAAYRDIVEANWKSFETALTQATVPEAIVSAADRAYGSLANWLGRSQLEIAKNLASPTAMIIKKEND